MWNEYPPIRIKGITQALNTLNKMGVNPEHIKVCVTDNMIGIFYYQTWNYEKVLKINSSKTNNESKLSDQIGNVVSILCKKHNRDLKSFQFGSVNNDFAVGKITLLLTFNELKFKWWLILKKK